jgi:hypothetical protein
VLLAYPASAPAQADVACVSSGGVRIEFQHASAGSAYAQAEATQAQAQAQQRIVMAAEEVRRLQEAVNAAEADLAKKLRIYEEKQRVDHGVSLDSTFTPHQIRHHAGQMAHDIQQEPEPELEPSADRHPQPHQQQLDPGTKAKIHGLLCLAEEALEKKRYSIAEEAFNTAKASAEEANDHVLASSCQARAERAAASAYVSRLADSVVVEKPTLQGAVQAGHPDVHKEKQLYTTAERLWGQSQKAPPSEEIFKRAHTALIKHRNMVIKTLPGHRQWHSDQCTGLQKAASKRLSETERRLQVIEQTLCAQLMKTTQAQVQPQKAMVMAAEEEVRRLEEELQAAEVELAKWQRIYQEQRRVYHGVGLDLASHTDMHARWV